MTMLSNVLVMNKSDVRIRNLSLLVLMGNLLYFLFPFPPIVWRLTLVAICLYIILSKSHRYSALEKWMLALSVLNVVYYFITYFVRGNVYMTHVGNNLCAFLPLCLFAYLSERGLLTEKFISIMIAMLLASSIVYYVHYERMKMALWGLSEGDQGTINASTVFLMLIPLLLYEKKRILLYVELAVCVFFIVSAVKRGNMVASILPISIFLYYQFKTTKRNAFGLFLLVVVIGVGAYYLSKYVSGSYYIQKRLEDTLAGNSSGRDRIYASAIQIWTNSNTFHFFFGNGYRAVTNALGTPAHSDWIEILVDNGIFGIVFYLGIFISFLIMIKNTHVFPEKLVLISAFLVWFAKSIYSMAYDENYMCLLMISIGAAMGKVKIKKMEQRQLIQEAS